MTDNSIRQSIGRCGRNGDVPCKECGLGIYIATTTLTVVKYD